MTGSDRRVAIITGGSQGIGAGLVAGYRGLLVMAAAMANDVLGWLGFSVLLGPMQGRGFAGFASMVSNCLIFTAPCGNFAVISSSPRGDGFKFRVIVTTLLSKM